MTLTDFLPCIYALVGCAAFSVVFEIRDIKKLASASFCGFVSWLVFTLCSFVGTGIWADTIRYFIATIAVAIFAEIFARVHKAPATLFLIIGIIPLVPGGGIYYTMEALINGMCRCDSGRLFDGCVNRQNDNRGNKKRKMKI